MTKAATKLEAVRLHATLFIEQLELAAAEEADEGYMTYDRWMALEASFEGVEREYRSVGAVE